MPVRKVVVAGAANERQMMPLAKFVLINSSDSYEQSMTDTLPSNEISRTISHLFNEFDRRKLISLLASVWFLGTSLSVAAVDTEYFKSQQVPLTDCNVL